MERITIPHKCSKCGVQLFKEPRNYHYDHKKQKYVCDGHFKREK